MSANDDVYERRRFLELEEASSVLEIEPEDNDIAFRINGIATFTLRPSPEFLKELAFVHDLTQTYEYDGPKLTPQMRQDFEAQINQHLGEAYEEIANEMGIDVIRENGKMIFMKNGAPITLQQRLDMENRLQETFNRYAFADNIVMVDNGNVDLIHSLLALPRPKPGNDNSEDDDLEAEKQLRYTTPRPRPPGMPDLN